MWEFSLLAPVGSRVTAEQKQYSSEVWPERQAAEIAQSGLAENPQTSAVCQLCLPLEPSQPPNPFEARELPPGAVKPLVKKMCAGGLSPRTVNKYVEYVKQVVKSLKAPNGEPIHKRTWTCQ